MRWHTCCWLNITTSKKSWEQALSRFKTFTWDLISLHGTCLTQLWKMNEWSNVPRCRHDWNQMLRNVVRRFFSPLFSASVMYLAEHFSTRADGRSCYCITWCEFGGLKFNFLLPWCVSVKRLSLLKPESVSLLNRSFRECLCKPGQIVPPITRFGGSMWSELNKLQNICLSGKGRINAAGTAPRPNGPAHTRTLDFLTDKMEQLTTGLKEERRHHCFVLYFTRSGSNNRHYCNLTFDEMACGVVKRRVEKGNQEEK